MTEGLYPLFEHQRLHTRDGDLFIDRRDGALFSILPEEQAILSLFNGRYRYRDIVTSLARHQGASLSNDLIGEIRRKFSKYIRDFDRPAQPHAEKFLPARHPPPVERAFPAEIILFLTEACNFDCEYCIRYGVDAKSLKQHVVLGILEEALANHCLKVTLTGGEPFLDRHIVAYTELLLQGNIYPQITTNGSFLTSAVIGRLAAAGLPMIQVSLDTTDRALFRKMTGRDDADKVMRNVKALIASGIDVVLKCVLTTDNHACAWQVAEFAAEQGAARVDFTPIQFTERDPVAKTKLKLSTAQIEATKASIQQAGGDVDIRFYSPNRTWTSAMDINSCGGYSSSLVVQANGGIGFCGNIPEAAYGNACRQSITSAWQSPQRKTLINTYIAPAAEQVCGQCTYFTSCQSGCPLLKKEQRVPPGSRDPRCAIWSNHEDRHYL